MKAETPPSLGAKELEALRILATRLRRHSVVATSEAGSGHPTTCLSCADLMAALFFRFLRFDLSSPKRPDNDRLVLSKGHAAPILWAALAEAGAFPVEHLKSLRKLESDLEGHPTPRNRWVDAATGSLGQGLSIGVGMAFASRLNGVSNRIYVLLGDGETAEGAVWEAAELASHRKLDNLTAILDVNGYGQSEPTMHRHDVEAFARRFSAFGWHTRTVDGHDMREIVEAMDEAVRVEGGPAVVIARTLKGKGVSSIENRDGWHGKPVPKGKELEKALAELGEDREPEVPLRLAVPAAEGSPASGVPRESVRPMEPPSYSPEESVATRQAYGTALKKLGNANPSVVALDGDTKNSTYSEKFMQAHPDRFFECFIAEQNMVGAAVGLAALGKIPFASTFACFLTRAYDFIRMAAISQVNVNFCGSHAGVSIGEDGPSQMGLEDLAMMRAVSGSSVLYPSDAVSTERLVELASQTPGVVYIRTSRPKTAVLYDSDERFPLGGCKILRFSAEDKATLVAAGITLHEALEAHRLLLEEGIATRVIDLYCLKPVDRETLLKACRETGTVVTVEDHYPEGGLGDAVLDALAGESFRYRKLAVRELPRSGESRELMDLHGISRESIVNTVRGLIG